MRKWPGLAAILLSVVLAGCASYPRQGSARFRVEVSFLDYVTFTYHDAARDPAPDMHPLLVRVQLSGSGHAQYARGRSSRVVHSFWSDREEPHLEDLFTDQLVLGPAQVHAIFQALVDAGVFERKMQGNQVKDPASEAVFIHARINGRNGVVRTDSPEFIGIYKRLAARFAR